MCPTDPYQGEPGGPIAFMASNRVAANLLMFLRSEAGGVAFGALEREAWPTGPFNTIEVSMAYPGATPEEVEESIVVKIKEQVEAYVEVFRAEGEQVMVLAEALHEHITNVIVPSLPDASGSSSGTTTPRPIRSGPTFSASLERSAGDRHRHAVDLAGLSAPDTAEASVPLAGAGVGAIQHCGSILHLEPALRGPGAEGVREWPLGFFGLSGVTISDSLVMMDFIDQRRREGADLKTAFIDGAKGRFRSIILTSVTTFLGFTTLILERAIQAQFLVPFAASLGVRIMIATGIFLLLVPALAAVYLRANSRHRAAGAVPVP